MIRELADQEETEAVARALAAHLRNGDVLALEGTLGIGKTVLARAIIRVCMGAPVEVPSPTFTLLQSYEAKDVTIHHFDLYRIEAPEEAYELGIEDAFEDDVSLVEWPERIAGLLPAGTLVLRLEPGRGGDGSRRLAISSGDPDWVARLAGLDT
ncbi:tRNA threonylcarbamoyladenosine biosynthesis protein TsaE [Oceanibacterium hippocampi]|uniref:tRNA threonylcarbamoyladenosine biosynthesis protein TsaE n=2 Tax=Oceanibacterium hippocampi TaxID=745714 RepID=A0A1Y5RP81_9PROT|nr:tRNA threonylcarbamoyladenosine biosynthesis protein TsaE [Oceanibacterium hippocampi]